MYTMSYEREEVFYEENDYEHRYRYRLVWKLGFNNTSRRAKCYPGAEQTQKTKQTQ
jgi:hypothetical protein